MMDSGALAFASTGWVPGPEPAGPPCAVCRRRPIGYGRMCEFCRERCQRVGLRGGASGLPLYPFPPHHNTQNGWGAWGKVMRAWCERIGITVEGA